jgi:predicted transposase YbfD/YdcC
MLNLKDAIVSIDAMGCQREIAQQILDKGADYILALKGSQGTLREDAELFAAEQKANGLKNTTVSRHETVDADHGRIETREYTVLHDVSWLQERHEWPGLKSVIVVESTRETGAKACPREGGDRDGNAILYHLAQRSRGADRLSRPQPLGDREQPSLGHGHGLPRR